MRDQIRNGKRNLVVPVKNFLPLAALLLWCVFVATLVRWPVSYYVWAMPTDSNIALHVLAARDFHDTVDPFSIYSLSFPSATPFRIIAWPVVLLSAVLQAWWEPVSAMNVAIVLLVTLQGVAVTAWGSSRGWTFAQRVVAVAAIEAAPLSITFLANSQIENLAYFSFCLIAWGIYRGAARGWTGVAAGLLAAGFSSPYQAIPAVILALILGAFRNLKSLGWVIIISAVSLGLTASYYASAVAPHLSAASGPRTRLAEWDAANLHRLVIPDHCPVDKRDVSDLASPSSRWHAVSSPPPVVRPDRSWRVLPLWHADYLGALLVVAGLVGLWKWRKSRFVWALGLSGVIATILSLAPYADFADRLSKHLEADTWIHIIWPLLAMKSTVRFLTLTTFVLAVGAAHLVRRWHPALVVLLVLALLADALIRAPGYWPVRGVYVDTTALQRSLPPGPIALWPPFHPEFITEYQVLAVATHRRLALCEPVWAPKHGSTEELWSGVYLASRNPDVRELLTHSKLPSGGLLPAEWLRTLHRAGVSYLIEVLADPDAIPPETTLPRNRLALAGDPSCVPGFCRWNLAQQLDYAAPLPAPPPPESGMLFIRCR